MPGKSGGELMVLSQIPHGGSCQDDVDGGAAATSSAAS